MIETDLIEKGLILKNNTEKLVQNSTQRDMIKMAMIRMGEIKTVLTDMGLI